MRSGGGGAVFATHQPDAVMHLAAESHVDRSIDGSAPTSSRPTSSAPSRLLEGALAYWRTLRGRARRTRFRFQHVSTDEVFGALGAEGLLHRETTPYDPCLALFGLARPASDHLARAWRRTYGLPVLITNCSQQLRALPFPREADPADDPQRAGGQAAAGLRRRRQYARLAAMSTTTPRALRTGARPRRARRDLQHRRPQRAAATSMWWRAICDILDELLPAAARPPTAT